MSLRKAKMDDHWRHTFARAYSSRLLSLKYQRLLCLSDDEITIPKGICAIVGGNGVGKSALLAAISELLANSEQFHGVGHKVRLKNSELEAKVVDSGTPKDLAARDDDQGMRQSGAARFESRFHWLESSYIVNLTQRKLSEDSAFHELLEPLQPTVLDEQQLNLLWYVLGKKIDSCLIYEISEYEDLDTFPYFVVESFGQQYGSEGMGFGELSLLSILWKLKSIEKNSILVLEEPETHVSPRSQRALMDVIAKTCDESGLSVILTTHSPSIIANLPQSNLVLLAKDDGRTKVAVGANKTQINDLLGAISLRRGLVLVEDRAAVQFLVSVMREINIELLMQVEVVDAGSASNIDSALKSVPKASKEWLTILGVYDGDMRGVIKDKGFNWRYLFLPGNFCPEEMLRENLLSMTEGVRLLSAEVRREIGYVRAALESVDGLDVHDWFTQLPNRLGCDHSHLMSALVRLWLSENQGAANELVANIEQQMNRA